MIFLTVGTQLPFDRLTSTLDEWSAAQPDQTVFAQIGRSTLEPSFPSVEVLDNLAYEQRFREADLVVSHVGIGIVLTCLDAGKPLIVMPRDADRGEHRNNHQHATAKKLTRKVSLSVAWDPVKLKRLLTEPRELLVPQLLQGERTAGLSRYVSDRLAEAR